MLESAGNAVFEIAALSDPHFGSLKRKPTKFPNHKNKVAAYRRAIKNLPSSVDLIAVTGDNTQTGSIEEAKYAASAFDTAAQRNIPVYAVLGNHDFFEGLVEPDQLVEIFTNEGGVLVLHNGNQAESSGVVIFERDCSKLGIVGFTGFSDDYGRTLLGWSREKNEPFCTTRRYGKLKGRDKTAAEIGLKALREAAVDKRALMSHLPVTITPDAQPHTLSSIVAQYTDTLDLMISGHKHSLDIAGETDLIDASGQTKTVAMHAGLPFRRIRI